MTYKPSDAPTSYATGMLAKTLQELYGFLEVKEGFGKTPATNGQVYYDSRGVPTIGYGFALLDINSKKADAWKHPEIATDGLIAVLDGIRDSSGRNVFQAANPAGSNTTIFAAGIESYFTWLINKKRGPDVATLQTALDGALQVFFAGNGSQLINGGNFQLPPPPGGGVSFSFAGNPNAAEAVLKNLLLGATINEGAAGTVQITGKSPLMWSVLSNHGAPPPIASSAQWEAIVDVAYNGVPTQNSSPALIQNALAAGNPSLAWYLIRYVASLDPLSRYANGTGDATRNILESQLYGLNGGSSPNSFALAIQDYQTLTEHRSKIIPFEQLFGADPDGGAGVPESIPSATSNAMRVAVNNIATMSSPSSALSSNASVPGGLTGGVSTLAQIFDSEADQIIQYLGATYGTALPAITKDQSGDADTSVSPFEVRSTDIYVAPGSTDFSNSFAVYDATNSYVVDARHFDTLPSTVPGASGTNASASLDPSHNHILIGEADRECLIGGLGNDILVGGVGNETLEAGAGQDTLIGGLGSDILIEGKGNDVFDCDFRSTLNPSTAVGIIVATAPPPLAGNDNRTAIVELNGTVLGTTTHASGLNPSGTPFQWVSDDGSLLYTFQPYSSLFTLPPYAGLGGLVQVNGSQALGELVISPKSATGPSIDIWNFDLGKAESSTSGFFGIKIQPQVALSAGTAQTTSTAGTSALSLAEGAQSVFTVELDGAADIARYVTLTLSGGNAADFAVSTGASLVGFNGGSATVAIPISDDAATLSLVNTADVGVNSTLQLSAVLDDATGAPISQVSTSLTVNYTEGPTSAVAPPSSTISGAQTVVSGAPVWLYQDDGANDFIQTADNPGETTVAEKEIVATAGGSDTIVLSGQETDYIVTGNASQNITDNSTGQTYILPEIGYAGGNDTIALNNNALALVTPGYGNNEIYGSSQTNLTSAIAQAKTGTGTGLRGELLAPSDGNNTIIGGTGNDLIMMGSGKNLVVAGPGNDVIISGVDVGNASFDWSTYVDSSNALVTDGVSWVAGAYTVPNGKTYEGNEEAGTGTPLGLGDDTIFAGKGSSLIFLSNGNNYVDGGSGNSTIQGGMGNNTIFCGTGNVHVHGGGGNDYIDGESGSDLLIGAGGNNTIIGGSGNDTIYAGSASSSVVETGNNYVQGGSGNDLIYGDGGNDTLLGGSGASTLYGGSGTEYMEGGSGNDLIVGGAGNDTLVAGGAGNDTMQAYGSDSTTTYIFGGDGNVSINGGQGDNVIYSGDGGTSTLPSVVQANWTDTNANSTIYGGAGYNELFGNVGTSVIYGGAGTAEIVAGTGNATIFGGSGDATIYGGSGSDVLYAADGGTESALSHVIAGAGSATIYGGAGDNWLQDLASGGDLIVGGGGEDTILGVGSDTIVAGSGNDFLQSNGGNVTFQFNQGFGDDTVLASAGGSRLLFGGGMDSNDFSVDPVVYNDGSEGLVISGDGGSVTFAGGQLPGMISNITFLDPSTPTLAQLIQQDGEDNSILYATTIDPYSHQVLTSSLIFNVDFGASLTGGDGHDTISAWGNDDVLTAAQWGSAIFAYGNDALVTGSSGADTLSASGLGDSIVAGSGAELFIVSDASAVISDYQKTNWWDTVQSWVSYTMPGGVEVMQLEGNGNLVGTGNNLADSIVANGGNDTLIAGSRQATLVGGAGNDTFVVNNVADVVQDSASTKNNVVQSSVSFALPTNINTLILTGGANLQGNANGANDTLISNAGVDTLLGGAGNDVFVVNNVADVVVVSASASTYTIQSSVSYVLPGNVQNLILTGSANLSASGNATAGTLVANTGNDSLIAGTGNETLVAGVGNDTLIAGSGADVLIGAPGASTYVVNSNVGNATIALGSGQQTIQFGPGISSSSVHLAAAITNGVPALMLNDGYGTIALTNEAYASNLLLSFTGAGSQSLSQLVQQLQPAATVTGASGRYLLDSSNAHVVTSASGDTVSAWGTNDTLSAGAGVSAVYAHGDGALVNGGSGNDTLGALGQNDTLVGGPGTTDFVVGNANDVVQDTYAGSNSTLQSGTGYALPGNINTLLLTGAAGVQGVANGGNDTLVSNSGVDTLIGGTGNDLFIANNAADLIQDSVAGGSNTLESAFSVLLPANVNTLLLTGNANLVGTGNGANDLLVGNAGLDTLVSGNGIDTLVGGVSGDVFVVNNAQDVLQNISLSASSTLQSSVNYALPTGINTLLLSGSSNLVGTANAAQDTLISNSGLDTLVGGAGNELFIVNNASDVVQDVVADVGSSIQASVSYALPTNINTLILSGASGLVGTANGADDTLIANNGSDTLVAGSGNDLFSTQTGNVTVQVGSGFGDDTIAAAGAVSTLSFGTGINPSDFTVDVVLDHDVPALVLSGDGGNITLDGALVPGAVGALQFANGVTLSLDQLLNQAPSLATELTTAGGHLIFDSATGDTLTPVQASDTLSGWGSSQVLSTNGQSNVVVDALGNNDTLASTLSTGAASLVGGGSSEVFSVAGNSDTIFASNGNTDTVVAASGSYTQTVANTYVNGVGYVLPASIANLVVAANGLYGAGSGQAAVLTAQGNSDTLVAASAADTLIGSGTNEVFDLFAPGNLVETTANGATDSIAASWNVTLPGSVNGLILLGAANLTGTANSGNDVLASNTGVDTLVGGAGNDLFVLNNGADVVLPGAIPGLDTIRSTASYQLPTGVSVLDLSVTGTNKVGTANAGNDTLIAEGGDVDTLVGGAGNDLFILGNGADVVQATGTGSDTIQTAANFTLPANVNTLVMQAASQVGVANSGNDTLVAGGPNDTLVGGAGNDTFVIGYAGDVIEDSTVGANNVAISAINFVLPANFNQLMLTGSSNLSGTGNGSSNTLVANSGNDTLIAGSGVATMIGGAGSDLFEVNSAADVVQDTLGGSNSTVQSSASYVLPTGISTLALTGTTNLSGTINGANETIVSNSGVDTLTGGAGSDVFIINNPADVIHLGSSTQNVVETSAAYTMPAAVNTLILTGASSVVGTANNGNDTLVSNQGVDTLIAGTGNDLFVISNGADVVQVGATHGADSIESYAVSYTLPSNVAYLALERSRVSATGNGLNDTLVAAGFWANGDNDTLIAGTAIATMVGGGATVFVVNNASDVLLEGNLHSGDIVETSLASYTLPSNIPGLILTTANQVGTGSSNGGIIYASSTYGDADTLIAGGGATTLVAGPGNEYFVVNDGRDTINETWLGSISTVQSSVNYQLSNELDVLLLTGSTNLTGSDVNTSNYNNNNDTIVSNAGVDTLIGGAVGDVFVVNNSSDVVTTNWNTLRNSLQASVSYVLPVNVDVLTLTGSGNLVGTANNDNDTLISNAGIDTLVGGPGNDTFVVNNAADVVVDTINGANSTIDAAINLTLPSSVHILVLTGSSNLVATARAGNDTLVANSGIDTLVGGTGTNVFVVNSASDVVQAGGAAANNTIQSSVNYTLPSSVGTLVLAGAVGLSATGGAGSGTLVANSANDTLIAGAGVATMLDEAGNALFIVNNSADVVGETVAGANSTVQSSVNTTLAANVGTLVLTGASALTGTANDGNDTLVSNTAIDTLVGGSGSDYFVINNVGDVIQTRAPAANNTIQSASSYTLPSTVNALVLTGIGKLKGTANNGNDTLVSNTGVDTLVGGSGNDVFVVNNSKDAIQTVSPAADNTIETGLSFILPSTANILILTGAAALSGSANAGNDTLVSNTGVDTLTGGTGNDLFVVNNASDVVKDTTSTTSNTIESSVSYVLPSRVDTLWLTGSVNLSATGNSDSDVLIANSGNDTLTAGTGAATMVGGVGSDLFIVNSAADVIQDSVAGANSTIQSSVSETLPSGANTLILTGSANLAGVAGAGNDTLLSNTGVDTLTGGSGNDLFVLNNAADVVQDAYAGFNNTIESSANTTLPTNVNTLVLTGTSNLMAVANGGNDTLESNTGVDTLIGGAGNDLFVVNNAADVVQDSVAGTNSTLVSMCSETLGSNINTLVLNNTSYLVGVANNNNDTLIANSAPDTLIGGTGTDVFVVNNSADVVTENTPNTHSSIYSSVSYQLPSNVNALVLTGTGDLTAYDNGLSAVLEANSGNDTLYSTNGVDTLIGGTGHDVFVVGNYADVVEPGPNPSWDTIVAAASYQMPSWTNVLEVDGVSNGGYVYGYANNANDTLMALTQSGVELVGGTGNDYFIVGAGTQVSLGSVYGVDTIEATGNYTLPSAINVLIASRYGVLGQGNGNNDTLIAEGNYDTLVAGSGVDTLIGSGASGVTFVANNPSDVVMNSPGFWADTLDAAFSETMPTYANALVLTGTADLTGTDNGSGNADLLEANAGNDTLIAGSGNDTLMAGAGLATMQGGTGNDLFVVNSALDTIQLGTTYGVDSVQSSANYTLPQTINVLQLTGSANLVGTGNSSNDEIVGNSGSDTLVAGNGGDTLVSGSNATTLVGGSGNDVFEINNSQDVIIPGTTPGVDTIETAYGGTLPGAINNLYLYQGQNQVVVANANNDLIVEVAFNTAYSDTLIGGVGLDVLVGGGTSTVNDTQGQAALLEYGAGSLTAGSTNDFFSVQNRLSGQVTVNVGASHNVVAIGSSQQVVLNTAAGGQNVLSLGDGMDTELLSFSKSGTDLVLNDGQAGSITLTNWYGNSASHTITTLQVVEQASGNYYNPASSDALRNQAIYEFNFNALVNQFNQALATDPNLTNWYLSAGMPTAETATSSTQAYGGDLAYYEGMNATSNTSAVQQMKSATVQSILQSASFGSGVQTIDAWSGISSGGGAAPMVMTSIAGTLASSSNTGTATAAASPSQNGAEPLSHSSPSSSDGHGQLSAGSAPTALHAAPSFGGLAGSVISESGRSVNGAPNDRVGTSAASADPAVPQATLQERGASAPNLGVDRAIPAYLPLTGAAGAAHGAPGDARESEIETDDNSAEFYRGAARLSLFGGPRRFVGHGALVAAQLEAKLASDPLALFNENSIDTEVHSIALLGGEAIHHRREDSFDMRERFDGGRPALR